MLLLSLLLSLPTNLVWILPPPLTLFLGAAISGLLSSSFSRVDSRAATPAAGNLALQHPVGTSGESSSCGDLSGDLVDEEDEAERTEVETVAVLGVEVEATGGLVLGV